MSTRSRLAFKVTINNRGDLLDLQISDPSNITADNLALATWGSSEVLANLLYRLDAPDFTGSGFLAHTYQVLEVGAGTGLVGMTAAAVWKVNACLTDLVPILPNIRANIVLNKQTINIYGGSICTGLLDWAHPHGHIKEDEPEVPKNLLSLPARVILAADTVYSEEHPELLTNVVTARLERNAKARFIMCYPLRIGYLDHIRDLWERLEAAGLECTEEGREKLGGEWDEDVEYEWCVWRWSQEER
jgi:predicted nicotinamide N-methyase